LPVFMIIVIGFFVGKIYKKLNFDIASKIAFFVFAPVMTIQVVRNGNLVFKTLGKLAIVFIIIQVILSGIMFFVSKFTKNDEINYKIHLLTVLFTNCGYYGYPIVLLTYGKEGLLIAVEYVLLFNLMNSTLGVLFASTKKLTFKESIIQMLKIPLIYAFAIGILLNIYKITLPNLFESTLTSLNNAAIPILLLVLGLELSKIQIKSHIKDVSILVGERLFLGPIIAFAFLYFFHLVDGLTAKVIILESAMPTAFNSMLLAKELGGKYKTVAATVFLSTLFSPLTLSLFIYMLSIFFK
jgi:malate permease and related proteins